MRYAEYAGGVAPGGGGGIVADGLESQALNYLGGFAGSQTNVAMLNLYGEDFIMPGAGSVTKIILRSTAARTAGELSAKVTVNGTGVVPTDLDVKLDGTTTNDAIKSAVAGTITFVQGDKLGIDLTSTLAWAPNDSDIQATIYYILD